MRANLYVMAFFNLTNNANPVYPDAILDMSRETASVFQLKRRYEKVPPQLILSPDFQRQFVWSTKQKSELIESIIMGIPLPALYVKENTDGTYVIVDGKQRLTTLFDFIDNSFRLGQLTVLTDLSNKCFSDLSPFHQNKIEDYTLQVNVIKANTPDRVTLDLFDRVNRGGTKLNNQEMRTALYQGTSTRLISYLADFHSFKVATEHSATSKRMTDRTFVLRFIAFYLWRDRLSVDIDYNSPLEYKSNLDDFLGKTMAFINTLDAHSSLITDLTNAFTSAMDTASHYIVKLGGFRLPSKEGKSKRRLNVAFFDSFSYLLAKTNLSEYQFNEAYHELVNNNEYVNAISYSVDSTQQVNKRFDIIEKFIYKYNK